MNNNDIELIEIIEKIYQKLIKEVTTAYYDGNLQDVLDKYDMNEKISYSYYNANNAKILVIGATRVKVNELRAIAEEMGIPPKRIDFELEYDKIQKYNFGKLQYSMVYSDVLIGPMPHSTKGKGYSSSFIADTYNYPEKYPNIVKLVANNMLKITKISFREALKKTKLYNC